MIRWSSALACLFLLTAPQLSAQNLFDAQHTREYANYLFQAGEFKLAAEEYERLAFLSPTDQDARFFLVQSHRKAGNNQMALYRLMQYFPADTGLTARFAGEKVRLLLLNGQLSTTRNFLASPTALSKRDHLTFQVTTELLDSQWKTAESLLANSDLRGKSPILSDFSSLTTEALTLKRKSPALSVGLSAIVPGLGKAYSGAWKDGLVSLVFVSITAWQGYRGFKNNGINSSYGWTFASISGAFYIGNLYGSAKAAKKRNRDNIHKIHHRVEEHFGRML